MNDSNIVFIFFKFTFYETFTNLVILKIYLQLEQSSLMRCQTYIWFIFRL